MLKIKELELLEEDCNVYFDEYVVKLDRNVLASAIKDVQRWQYTDSNSFNIQLIKLIAKADDNNKSKLMQVYPEFVIAHNLWFWKDVFDIKYQDDEHFFDYVFARLKYSKN